MEPLPQEREAPTVPPLPRRESRLCCAAREAIPTLPALPQRERLQRERKSSFVAAGQVAALFATVKRKGAEVPEAVASLSQG